MVVLPLQSAPLEGGPGLSNPQTEWGQRTLPGAFPGPQGSFEDRSLLWKGQSLNNIWVTTFVCESVNTRTSFPEGTWFQSGSQEECHFESAQVGWDGVGEQRKKLSFVRQALCASYQANFLYIILFNNHSFPGGTTGKASASQCRRCKGRRFDSWVRKIPWSRKWQPTPVSLPG